MTQEVVRVDVSQEPRLRDLAREVQRTRQPRVLRDEGEDLAVVVPIEASVPERSTVLPTSPEELENLFRVHHTLKQPLTWEEITTIAEEEAADEAVRGW